MSSQQIPPPGPYIKSIGNAAYHGAVVGGLAVTYTMLGKRLLKIKPADLGALDLENDAKVVGVMALSLWTRDMLVAKGIIPADLPW